MAEEPEYFETEDPAPFDNVTVSVAHPLSCLLRVRLSCATPAPPPPAPPPHPKLASRRRGGGRLMLVRW